MRERHARVELECLMRLALAYLDYMYGGCVNKPDNKQRATFFVRYYAAIRGRKYV